MPKVLIADKLPDAARQALQDAGLQVVNRPGLDPEELMLAVEDVDGLIVRSGAQVTADVIDAAENLRAICRAGVGVDNIDILAASQKGIVVMNTPGANTISTAEHAFALILALSRNIGPAYIAMRGGRWDRKKFTGTELAGTTLGIIGLGRVGQAVAARAASFRMKIIAHDPFISHEVAGKMGVHLAESMEEVLSACDYLTVHVPGNEQTRALIGEEQIALMKPGARIINCARGDVVDQDAVVKAVRAGLLAGAAFDVYASEPPDNYDFAGDDRILATPHLGASTDAAQLAVGEQAVSQIIEALTNEQYPNALNTVAVSPEVMERLQPYCNLAMRLGKSAGCLNRGRPVSVQVTCQGEIAAHDTTPVVNYGVMGVLQSMLGDTVNIVSAPHLAQARGVQVTGSSSSASEGGFTDLVTLALVTDAGEIQVAGTVFERRHQRIVRIGQFRTEVIPEGHLLVVFGKDRPGMIGRVGAAVCEVGINIARMFFDRTEPGGDALLALNLDSPCDTDALETICSLDVVDKAVLLSL